MKTKTTNIISLISILLIVSCGVKEKEITKDVIRKSDFALVIHGGAGYIYEGRYSSEEEAAYKEKLEEALRTGYEILNSGGSSLDAVEKTIHVLENSPLFNAGRGSVLTSAETVEMDAAIMDGSNLNAGAVAGIKHIKNPISLARAVMEKSKHVMMIGEGAETFAGEAGFTKTENDYFITNEKLEEIRRIKAEERKNKSGGLGIKNSLDNKTNAGVEQENKFGTVGCAAIDKNGNLAAGTSTGGMANKKWGRVGDVPVIGAGTYANGQVAISATGHGEFFIRNVVSHDIAALMEYKNFSLEEAADLVVMHKLVEQKGGGGIIAIDKYANITFRFNTQGMFRGYIKDDGKPVVAMYKD